MKKGLLSLLFAAFLMPFALQAQYNAPYNVVTDTVACDSFTWNVNGQTYTADALVSLRSGDTLYILNLVIDHNKTYTVPGTVDGGCTYTWGDSVLNTSGIHRQHFETVLGGCDSLVTINLSINTVSHKTYTVSACASYDWHDSTYTETTTTTQSFQNSGCDSVLTLNLTIINPTQKSSDTVVTACDRVIFGFSRNFPKNKPTITEDTVLTTEWYLLNGHNNDKAQWNVFHKRTTDQCYDSIATAHITINQSTFTSSSVKECDSYTFIVGDQEYFYDKSTKDTVKLDTTSLGCDSNMILNITINPSPIITINGEFDVTPNNGSTVLYATSDLSGVKYTWDTECTHTVTGANNDTIHLTGITGNVDVVAIGTKTSTGCQGTGNITVLANVGINSADLTDVNIYPNPTADYLHVECGEGINNIAIFNALGQRIILANELGSQATLNLTDLTNGTYSMRIELKGGKVINRNFVVAR